MRRTAALYAPAAVVLAAAWLALVDEGSLAEEAIVVALLALAPALVPGVIQRALVGVAAAVLAAGVAFGSPREAGEAWEGILTFWDVSVPFSAVDQPRMGGVVVLAVFVFSLGAALAIATRRPLGAALVTLAGAGWPATLVGAGTARGAPVLAVVLLLLAAGGARPVRAWRGVALAGVLVVVVGLAGATSSALAKDELLEWKRWDPYDRPDEPVSVAFAWNANYGGISFPDKETEVLRVDGVRRPLYWRATTLDTFDGLRWREDLTYLGSNAVSDARLDPLFPRRGRDRRRWLRADVTVLALRDRRLPGPSMPVRYDAPQLPFLNLFEGGIALTTEPVQRETRYTVSSYVPRPTPAQLADARVPETASAVDRYLELAPGVVAQPWGTPGRRQGVLEQLTQPGPAGPLLPYRSLVDVAERIGGARGSPYAAAVSIETWLRSQGGFRYDEQPEVTRDVPPLVGFVTRNKEGYCQHFAGAMALMLRTLGVPARVAAGFTSGSYEPVDDRPRWVVTDHDAHTWVEVWFEGWGWVPFDPTPGRGQLVGSYSPSSPDADFRSIRDAVRGDGRPEDGFDIQIGPVTGPGGLGNTSIGGGEGLGLVSLLLFGGAAAVAAIGLAKLARRRWRYLRRDPRGTALACRAELVDFLADQGIRVADSVTPAELAAEVRSAFGVDASGFANALADARFAPPSRASWGARRARAELATVRRRLRAGLTRTERLRGLVSLRSLGLAG